MLVGWIHAGAAFSDFGTEWIYSDATASLTSGRRCTSPTAAGLSGAGDVRRADALRGARTPVWAGGMRRAAGGVGVRRARRAACPACGQSFLAPFLKSEHLGSFWLV